MSLPDAVAPHAHGPAHRHGHDHAHHGVVAVPVAGSSARRRRALWWALGFNAAFVVVEVAVGLAAHSLALVADATHMLSDVLALLFALGASSLATRPATRRHTYGFGRVELVAAQVNAITLLTAAVWIVLEAVRRAGADNAAAIHGSAVITTATVGLVVNIASALVLARVAGQDLNVRGAYLHMATDALGSLAAIASGVAVVVWHADWVDPIASVAVAGVTVVGGWRLLRRATSVLLDATPDHIDADAVSVAMRDVEGVTDVHHLHIWSLAAEHTALSAHVVLDEAHSLHDAQGVATEIKAVLATRHGIAHATLEMECHDCETVPTYLDSEHSCN